MAYPVTNRSQYPAEEADFSDFTELVVEHIPFHYPDVQVFAFEFSFRYLFKPDLVGPIEIVDDIAYLDPVLFVD